jgi:putative hydrolase of the HAD superfamily
MRKPEAILFDLWGTLIDSDGFDPGRGNAAVLAMCDNPRGVTLGEMQTLGSRVVSALEKREDQSALEFTQASLLRILADALDLRFHKTLQETEWEFWKAALEIHLIDGVRELLPIIAGMDIRMGVVSNSSFSSATLENELERRGIRKHFGFVISSADYGVRKPDPIIFEVALARLRIGAEKTWFAGDNVAYDIEGAHGAGIFPVAFNPLTEIPANLGEHAVITQWSQLMPLVVSATGR